MLPRCGRHDDDELDALLRSASPSPPVLDPETADAILRTAMRDFRRARPRGVGWRLFAWGAAASVALGAATAPALVRPGGQTRSAEAGLRATPPPETPEVALRGPVVRPDLPRPPIRAESAASRPRRRHPTRLISESRKPARRKHPVKLASSEIAATTPAAAGPAPAAQVAPQDVERASADLALARQVEEARRQQALALAPRLLVTAVPPIEAEGTAAVTQGCDPSFARAASVQTDPLGGITRTEVTVTPEQPEPQIHRVALRPWWSMSW